MNKYLRTLLFYVISFAVIFILNMISPTAHDGGLGLGGLAAILLTVTVLVLVIVNVYRGIKKEKGYFVIAGIHLFILFVMIFRLFL
jgi:hypothetical protein